MSEGQKLFRKIIRVPKEESAFTYFQLEANEGLAFYSTLPFENGDPTRDLQIIGSISTQVELEHLLSELAKEFKVEIILDETLEHLTHLPEFDK